MACLKCEKTFPVTGIKAGAIIQCPHPDCGNISWVPEYKPPWWAKTSKFVTSLIVSYIIGVLSSFTVWKFTSKDFENPPPGINPTSTK